jgi:Respiratory-chain NADH dehydrogenase, 30 Kd subunit
MIDLEPLAAEIGVEAVWHEQNGFPWLAPESLDVRRMAEVMNAHAGRFITIAAQELPEKGGIRLDYHWDLDGTLATVTTKAENGEASSIRDLCKAADWIEREIHEYFAVNFRGRECEPLFLRPGTAIGVNLHKEDE